MSIEHAIAEGTKGNKTTSRNRNARAAVPDAVGNKRIWLSFFSAKEAERKDVNGNDGSLSVCEPRGPCRVYVHLRGFSPPTPGVAPAAPAATKAKAACLHEVELTLESPFRLFMPLTSLHQTIAAPRGPYTLQSPNPPLLGPRALAVFVWFLALLAKKWSLNCFITRCHLPSPLS